MKNIFLVLLILTSFASKAQCANFTADFNTSTVGDTIYFTNTSTNTTASTSYFWSFSGFTSYAQNPSFITSSLGGLVSVCLTITDSSFMPYCTSTQCDSVFITPDTTCNINLSYTTVASVGNLYITNTSMNVPVGSDYVWLIGGNSYTVENPIVPLNGLSNPASICFATNDNTGSCEDSICDLVQYVDSTACNLETDFTYLITGNSIQFTNTSTNQPTNAMYDWTIDGIGYSSENLTVPYYDSLTSVCFTVWSNSPSWCADTLCQTIIPPVDSCNVQASFTYSVVGNLAIFTNTSTDEPLNSEQNWMINGMSYYGDVVTVQGDSLGYYEACLTVGFDAPNWCYDTYCDTIVSTPVVDSCNIQANFTYVAIGDSLIFTNTSTNEPMTSDQNWTINGLSYYGNTVQIPNYDSTYTVCLTVGFDWPTWCYDTYCDTIVSTPVVDSCNVQANFTYVAISDSLIFTNTSTNEPITSDQNWTINGLSYYGNTVQIPNYDSTYTVCLTVGFDWPMWCYDTYCDTITISNDTALSVNVFDLETLNIFPNPVDNVLNIEILNGNTSAYRVLVYNIVGDLLIDKSVEQQERLSVDYLSSGLYFIKLMKKDQLLKTQKFVKR